MLSLAITLALWFQYTVGPSIVHQSGWLWHMYRWIPGVRSLVYHTWYDSCSQFKDDVQLLQQCAGYAGAYRPMAVATIFFLGQAIATKYQPDLNRQVWPAKFAIFLFAVFCTILLPSSPFFDGIFLHIARIGATIFIVLQQVILIDVAYNWNEDWVDRADQADRLSYGSGSGWLHAIVGTCATFYILSLTGIILLYKYFDGCAGNTWIITLTLLGIIAFTAVQLSGSEGSLLTSSVMSLYAVYLAYSMVSKNPNGACNPQLGENDVWGMIVGLTLTAVSLAWTGWSWTAEDRLGVDAVQSARPIVSTPPAPAARRRVNADGVNLDIPFLDPDTQATSGLVVMDSAEETFLQYDTSSFITGSGVWKLNVVMALICCWVAMTLTGWGATTTDEQTAANPTVGKVNMAMIGMSQWFAIALYIWTLIAPRVFPDRDFS